MRRVNLFLAILIASIACLAVVVAVGVSVLSSSPFNWGNGMMGGNGGMMGGNGGTVQNSSAGYFWVAFIVLIGVVVVGVVGLAYYVAVPEIRVGAAPVVCETMPKENVVQASIVVQEPKVEQPKVEQKTEPVCTPLESIVKTLTDDERKVVDVLAGHDGKYLQKYIRNEAGLSRLQTHRIVARLAERGIVTLEKVGNTNQVLLVDWLKKA